MRRRTTPRSTSPLAAVAVLAAATFGAGCATEVVDPVVATTAAPSATVAPPSLAGADLDTLVDVLRSETEALARATFDSDRAAAEAHLSRINEAWGLAEPLIFAEFGELADQITYDLRRVVGLARTAVERNRPADASKALKFLQLALVTVDAGA